MEELPEHIEKLEDEVFRKLALLILTNLEKHGPERVANEINSESDGCYYVIPTDDGVREYASNLINKKFI